MEDFSKKIVERIKKARIMPEARWKLNWKSYIFWALMVAMVLLGALFFSFMIMNIMDVDLRVLHFLGVMRFVRILVMTAPLLWIVLSLLALSFGVLALRKTNRGYRHSLMFATSLTVLIISIAGTLVHMSKINDRFDREFGKRMPGFHEMGDPRRDRWNRPGEGLLAGEISEVREGEFDLKDLSGETWKVSFDGETDMEDVSDLEVGLRVGIIGEKQEGNLMKALSIRKAPFFERSEGRERPRMNDEDRPLPPRAFIED